MAVENTPRFGVPRFTADSDPVVTRAQWNATVDALDTALDATAGDAAYAKADGSTTTYAQPIQAFVDIPEPWTISHRGGGANIAPEGTALGRRLAGSAGGLVIDAGDIRRTADGIGVDMHDATLDRTTNLTGNVSAATMARLLAAGVVDCSTWFGGNWPDQPIPSFAQTLAEFGKAPLFLEVKDATAGALVAGAVNERGAARQTLVGSFVQAALYPARDVGCPVILFKDDGLVTPATLTSNGVDYIGVRHGTVTLSQIDTLIAAGLKVLVYTVERHSQIDTYAGKDIAGWASDDPIYTREHIAGTYAYRRTADPFASQTFYHGHVGPLAETATPQTRGGFVAPNFWGNTTGFNPNKRFVLQGWGCPLVAPTSYALEFKVRFSTLPSDTSRWGGVFMACPTDSSYDDNSSADENGYLILVRANGSINWWKRVAGVATAAPVSLSTTALTAGVDATIRVTVTATDITLERVDTASSTTWADATHRGAYFQFGWDLTDASAQVLFSAASIT